jgi:hypothetical protein
MQYCMLLLGRAGSLVQAFPAIKDIAILSLVYELISTCTRVMTEVIFSLVNLIFSESTCSGVSKISYGFLVHGLLG